MKQTKVDRRHEAIAGHRVDEKLDRERAHKRADEAAGGRKANKEERAERSERHTSGGYPDGMGKVADRPLTEAIGRAAREAGEKMAGEGAGMMPDRGKSSLGPDSSVGGALGTPAPRMGKIPAGHGPQ